MIPYAILSGNVSFSDGKSIDIRILDLSVEHFTFRLAKQYAQKEITEISLRYFHFDKCIRQEIRLITGKDFKIYNYLTNKEELSKSADQFFDLYKVVVKNAKSEEYVKILTNEYMKYVELKLAGDDAAMSRELVGYPAELDEIYPKTVQEWRENCLRDVDAKTLRKVFDRDEVFGKEEDLGNDEGLGNDEELGRDEGLGKKRLEFALNLNTSDLLEKFLEFNWQDFLAYIEKEYYLDKIPVASDPELSGLIRSIYIGNQFDARLLPDEELLTKVMQKIDSFAAGNISVQTETKETRESVGTIESVGAIDVVGAIESAESYRGSEDRNPNLKLVLQLPPMKEDQISRYVKLLELYLQQSKGSDLPEIVVNDIGMCELVREHFPNQFEITLGILLNKRRKDVRLPYKKGYHSQMGLLKKNSLDADFYQAMLMETYGIKKYSYESCQYPFELAGDGHVLHLPYYQMNTGGMADKNREEYIFYPSHLHMIGKNNSLFGYDCNILTDPDYLQGFLKQKPSRIVLELI